MASYGIGKTRAAFEHSLGATLLNRELRNEPNEFAYRCNTAFYAAKLGDFAFVNAAVESARREGLEINETLQAAQMRTVRAVGGDIAPFLELFEHAVEKGTPFLVYALGCDLPWMIDDRSRAKTIALRALEKLIAGLSSRRAGERLAIGARTVETHLANVYAKLGINSRTQLAGHFAPPTEST